MKKTVLNFLLKGMVALGIGPIVLVIVYLILHAHAGVNELSVREVVVGIISLSALAFIAGGMNAIYKIERLPLMAAILIHGVVLYIGYLITYLVNGWLQMGVTPILTFTVIFIIGYFVIWGIVYLIIRKDTARINKILNEKQQEITQT